MANPPAFVQAGAGATDAGLAWAYTTAAPAAAGNLIIVQVLQDGVTSSTAITITSATNVEDLAGTDGVFTALAASGLAVGSGTAAYQYIFLGRSLSTSAIVITGGNTGSDDVYVRSYEFTGVNTGTTLASVIENIGGTSDLYLNGVATSVTVADSAVVTSGPDRLALNFVALNDDALGLEAFAGETGGNWVLPVAIYETASGTDGTIALNASYASALSSTVTGLSALSILGETGTTAEQAQSFTTGSAITTDSIYVNLRKSGTPTDNLVVEIQTDSANTPSGSVVGTVATVSEADLTTTTTWYKHSAAISLSAATKYWLVFRRSGARDATNFFTVSGSDADVYASNDRATKASGTWTASSAQDIGFAVLTSADQAGVTINGGTDTILSGAWGVVGFALIGTTVPEVSDPFPTLVQARRI